MGWAIILILALLVFAGLWPFIGKDKGALQFLGAALLVALAGYAWQGRPALAGSPKPPPERVRQDESAFAQTREDMLGRFDNASRWLTIADSYQRRGDTRSGAEILQSALRQAPRDADLWVGLGNALVVHSGGMMSPAAQLAFARAERIAPDHPGPRFFYGLALAQGGNFDQAEQIWRQLLAEAPADAEYRATIQERLDSLQQARAMGQIPSAPQRPNGPPSEGEGTPTPEAR
ncbi:tetratricopeptide repeat protein [Sphingosinicella sp. LHD-64]|uniref:tetratricopeptide repeat protein n=1 Tax=Sphingosinicella sp. LHD-64 TaxID=3072139 RepID=UPI00280EB39B|nr:tetratricopeptide repeat protein [Sphingosinicella sp. LHD-64]MDQ8754652.1 tetratricopeptide repeat protein [Sphingosinicella sp. LHD-64]